MARLRLCGGFSVDIVYCCYFLRSISDGFQRFELYLNNEDPTGPEIHAGHMDDRHAELR